MTNSERTSIDVPRSLTRAVAALRQVANAGEAGCRFVELREQLALPPMTLSRLLQALLALGLLQQNDQGHYRTGPALFDLLPEEEPRAQLFRVGREPLRELAERTGQSTGLFYFDGEALSCIARELQVDSVVLAGVGHQVNGLAYHPAALCCFSPARWRSILAVHPADDRVKFQKWLEAERQRLDQAGYAAGHLGERGRIAAPILDQAGQPRGALLLGAARPLLTARQMADWGSQIWAAAGRVRL